MTTKIKTKKANKLVLEIDLDDLNEYINKYLKRKIQAHIREYYINEIEHKLDYPDIHIIFPDMAKRIEKIEDFINDIERGWSTLVLKKK